jgi:hypothetical protein
MKDWKEEKKKETEEMLSALAEKMSSAESVEGYLNKQIYLLPDSLPCRKWSQGNQFLLHIAGTSDARGYKQWKEVGRQVKKGAKSIKILAPGKLIKVGEEYNGAGELVPIMAPLYFRTVPVFAYEDTEGEELGYIAEMEELRNRSPEELPLYGVAKKLGIPVTYDFSSHGEYGYYLFAGRITLCTDEEQTWYHELSHAIDHKIGGLSETGDRKIDEIVAEFTACFLASQYGKRANLRYTKEYIKAYSGATPVSASLGKAMERSLAIIRYITEG